MAKFKVGDKVRVREDLVVDQCYGGYSFSKFMEKYKGEIFTIKYVYPNGAYDLGNCFIWTDEMLEEVKEEVKMEKTFRQVIADIKEGEVWESSFKTIAFKEGKVLIERRNGSSCPYVLIDEKETFKLQRKEYTFQEAFKAYEEGKEIEDCNKVRYKKIDGADCYNLERDSHFCTKADENDYWFGFEEIRGKWYII